MIFLLAMMKKLVPNFFAKEKHVVCYKNLQLYLRLGLKIKKVHCVLKLDQYINTIQFDHTSYTCYKR